MQVAISGASGLIGAALSRSLQADGHAVRPMVRIDRHLLSVGAQTNDAEPVSTPVPEGAIRWNPADGTIDAAGLDGVDAVVHLAGAGIGDRRWTDRHKQAVYDSRIDGTSLIATTLAGLDHPPKVFVSGSAIGYYGDRGDELLTESSSPGRGFLAELTVDWEAATAAAADAGIRTVLARTGMVLSMRGGAFPPLRRISRWGLGGRLGSGRQWMSWITLADQVAALRFLIDHDSIAGPVNLVAPQPVTNAAFAKALGQALRRPAVLPIPRFGPRLVLGREMADHLLFYSERVSPRVLTKAGHEFTHCDLDDGLRAALADTGSEPPR